VSTLHSYSVTAEFLLFSHYFNKAFSVACSVCSAKSSLVWVLVRLPLWVLKGGCSYGKNKEGYSGGLGHCGVLLRGKKCWTICYAGVM